MKHTHTVTLRGIGETDAPLGVVSMPIPDDCDHAVTVDGCASQSVPVGFWPRSERVPGGRKRTRRALVFFEKSGETPAVRLSPTAGEPEQGVSPWQVDVTSIRDIARHRDDHYWHYYERPGQVQLRFGGKQVAFSLGVRNEFGTHLWQYVLAQKLWSGPLVEAWRIGGHIYTAEERPLTMEKFNEVSDILVFPDATVAASVYLLLFANGTIQVTGHWINGRIYGNVGNQQGAPVVVFNGCELPERTWDGSDGFMDSGGVAFDFSAASDLVSAEHPGSISRSDSDSAWQPVGDTRIVIRHEPADGSVKDIEVDGSSDGLVKGVARSVTWHMGLGDAAPGVARYVAPPDWYAKCCEFAPFPIELADGEFEELGHQCAEVLLRNSVKGKFTSGGIYRYLDQYGLGCYELSMDANETRSMFRRAYRDSDARFYDLGLRSSYFMADIATDHSRDVIHYHNDAPDWRIYSLIYQRFSGIVLGYMETGDYYLLETAQAVARNYISHHLQNWPRQGIGRDADPLNGFLMLWDYTGAEEFFEFAREFAHHVALALGDHGTWLCGAGVGPQMGCNAIPGTPWNGGHLFNGFTEYAMRDPNVPADWLESARRGLEHLYDMLEEEGGFHPASSGFIGRLHWYLACRLGDPDLIERTRKLMDNIVKDAKDPARKEPVFTGPSAHHMNNYADYLIFYEATKDTLPEKLSAFGRQPSANDR